MHTLYPMKLKPALKDYLWGGTRLKEHYGKETDLAIVAESWELSCHPDGLCTVENGVYRGETLCDVVASHPALLGRKGRLYTDFPLLIKLIDARDHLSIQVHPDDAYAKEHEGGYGKTEMWYVVEAEAGASLIYGFQGEISKEDFRNHIEGNTLLDIVREVPVEKGDVFFIEAGTLHAIGRGMLVAEVQQNSNATYRVYDFGRIGADGRPRELHIAKALDVTRRVRSTNGTKPYAHIPLADVELDLLAACELFIVYRASIHKELSLRVSEDSFQSVTLLDGEIEIDAGDHHERIWMQRGDTAFLPAGLGGYTLQGAGTILLTELP